MISELNSSNSVVVCEDETKNHKERNKTTEAKTLKHNCF